MVVGVRWDTSQPPHTQVMTGGSSVGDGGSERPFSYEKRQMGLVQAPFRSARSPAGVPAAMLRRRGPRAGAPSGGAAGRRRARPRRVGRGSASRGPMHGVPCRSPLNSLPPTPPAGTTPGARPRGGNATGGPCGHGPLRGRRRRPWATSSKRARTASLTPPQVRHAPRPEDGDELLFVRAPLQLPGLEQGLRRAPPRLVPGGPVASGFLPGGCRP